MFSWSLAVVGPASATSIDCNSVQGMDTPTHVPIDECWCKELRVLFNFQNRHGFLSLDVISKMFLLDPHRVLDFMEIDQNFSTHAKGGDFSFSYFSVKAMCRNVKIRCGSLHRR